MVLEEIFRAAAPFVRRRWSNVFCRRIFAYGNALCTAVLKLDFASREHLAFGGIFLNAYRHPAFRVRHFGGYFGEELLSYPRERAVPD